MLRPAEFPASLIQIVGPTDNWILQKLSKIPGPGFRFGMMKELLATAGAEISPSTDLSELETTIDQAAAFLYCGRSGDALQLLENAERRFPFVRHLIATLLSH